jgi:ankyrin repeat protein
MSMSMSMEELRDLFQSGNLSEVKKYLENNPTFNVNEALGYYGSTALHIACYDGHHDIVSLLLVDPQINVNLNNDGSTPFLLGCRNGKN